MSMLKKKVFLILLVIAFLATSITPLFANGEEHRFYIMAQDPDWGTKWFYFRCKNSFDVSYDTGETVTYNHYVSGWKQPVDNIFPPEIGNGSMSYIKCQLINNSSGSIVDETYLTGNYEIIYPSDWIYFYWWRSSSYSQSLSGPNIGGYTVKDKILALPPSGWQIIYNEYSDPTYSL
ncbi:MAG: hypothetical protein ACOYVD_04270 [Bacillota bacterium]